MSCGCVLYKKLLESRICTRLPPGLEWGPIALGLVCARSLFIYCSTHTLPDVWWVWYVYAAGYIHYYGLVRGMGIWPGLCTFRQVYRVGMICATRAVTVIPFIYIITFGVLCYSSDRIKHENLC